MMQQPIDHTERVRVALAVAESLHGTAYIWGGDNPQEGFDCSGLIVEILKSCNLIAENEDFTAWQLWHKFVKYRVETPYRGCLAFYWNSARSRVVHVEFCVNRELSIGASGGGSKTTTVARAIKDDAYIKYRPILRRRPVTFVDPMQAPCVYLQLDPEPLMEESDGSAT